LQSNIINSYFKQFLQPVNGVFPVEGRAKTVNKFTGVKFFWRQYDALYFDILGVHAARACDGRFCYGNDYLARNNNCRKNSGSMQLACQSWANTAKS